MAGGIAWRHEVDAAFADARAAGRPVFLYWGAGWCPPCNRVKADIFTNDDVVAQLAGLVPVWLDGDTPGAQALAERLKLRSYPTLVLYTPAGAEITRLPCELDGEAFAAALAAALAAGHGAAAALAAALDGSRALSADEWTLLAHYSWDTDEGAILQDRAAHTVLAALAQACPVADAAVRLRLLALTLQADAAAAPWLLAVCRDSRLARANLDILNNHGGTLVRQSGDAQVAAALARAAQDWAGDMWLAQSDRLMAVRLQARMARLGHAWPGMPEQVRAAVADALAAADGPYERHTLVNTAASALNDAGLHDAAAVLLEAELITSHAPYYFMLSLASAARRRGDTAAMLDWYEQAWRTSTGPATRLQWGATYLLALLESAADSADDRIAAAAAGIATDVAATPDTFHQRNRAQLLKLADRLATVPAAAALLTVLRAGL